MSYYRFEKRGGDVLYADDYNIDAKLPAFRPRVVVETNAPAGVLTATIPKIYIRPT